VYVKIVVKRDFDMWRAFDILLAAEDFCSDVLFLIEAFDVGAITIAIASSVCLAIAVGFTFSVVLGTIWLSRTRLDFVVIKKHPACYTLVIMFAAADIEMLKLLPWEGKCNYDGFPTVLLACMPLAVAFIEDVPQLILNTIYLATYSTTPIAVISLVFTVLSLLWRVAKRFMVVLAQFMAEDESGSGWMPRAGRGGPVGYC